MFITRSKLSSLFSVVLSLAAGMSVAACAPEDSDEVSNADPYTFVQPSDFPMATYTFQSNPITKEGFELGRMLFYDPIMSSDSTVSCSTCHRQSTGFADPTHRINHGVHNRFGKRNAAGLGNMAFRSDFFYDGGAVHLDFVPINAITSPVEMDNTLDEVLKRLQRQEKYADAFNKAFSETNIGSQQLLQALSQFIVMMVSSNSKYDQVMRNEGQSFTESETAGKAIFISKCSACHSGVLFTDDVFRNNGLDDTFDFDPGRSLITEEESDKGKFRTPSLRNVAVTPPYMHDGRFNTLSDVLEYYNRGVKDSPTLDPLLKQNERLGISITADEKSKLISFLETLTDRKLLSDKRFSDPF